MVQSDSVRSKAGQQGRMRDEKPIWRADDRLSQTTQTAWERSRNNIRSQQVHDHLVLWRQITWCYRDKNLVL